MSKTIDQVFAFVAQGDGASAVKIITRLADAQNTTFGQTINLLRDDPGRTVLHVASRHGHIIQFFSYQTLYQ